VNYFTEACGISVHICGYRMAANFRMARRANLNIRGWQGRWRHTAPTALFFMPSIFLLPRFIPPWSGEILADWWLALAKESLLNAPVNLRRSPQ
jgi:hypothetical protein